MKRELYEASPISDEESDKFEATGRRPETSTTTRKEVYISNLASHIAFSVQACQQEVVVYEPVYYGEVTLF